MNKITAYLFFLILMASCAVKEKPFYTDIQQFQVQDSISPPQKDILLFIGSSSFTRWKTMKEDLHHESVVNRGFGGSTLVDLMTYKDEVVLNYKPKKIIIYCGENDIASSEKVTPQIVFSRFTRLFNLIRTKYPDIPIIYISIKPSPSRWNMKDRMIASNQLIANYLKSQNNTEFINVWDKMLAPNGKPNPEIYVSDSLHMNQIGYEIWIKELRPIIQN